MTTMTAKTVDQSTDSPTAGRYLPLLLILFVGSGCAALIYEIVWLQLLQLIIGSTAISLGVLLGAFMGGMCLGSLLLPRLISRNYHPLRVYATLELLIGVMGLLVLKMMPLISEFYTAHAPGGWGGLIFHGLIAGVCLLPPTLLMGATLPAIARWVETSKEGVSWLGFFYGGNIAGAVFGCLWAGFYLLRIHDMAYATYCAMYINLSVAILAGTLAAFVAHRPAGRAEALIPEELNAPRRNETDPWAWTVYIAIALSGLTGLGAEVVWTRLLSLMLGMTVYAFSNILAVFLIGLGIGSTVGAMWARQTTNARAALGVCQLLLAGACGWAAYTMTYSLPYWPIDPTLSTSPWHTFSLDLARVFWVVLPGALLWGASFPLALAAAASVRQDPGRLVGGVYAANTVGAIIGALTFSILIIPNSSTKAAQQALIVICAISALFVLVPVLVNLMRDAGRSEESNTIRFMFGTTALVTAIVGIGFLVFTVSTIPWVAVAFGRFSAQSATTNYPDRYGLYVGEGRNVSVAVTKYGDYTYFHGAGKVQASSMPQDMHLQRMLGHLSALIARKNEKVLVVACGAGVTAGSFVPYPTVQSITICDIEPLVPHNVAAKFFKKENYGVVDDPRTTVVIDDGRHFVRTTKEKFDIITSDPIDPWVKGCASLNTIEYYQMCKEHLNPGGVVSLWIPLYESKLESAQSLITTFFQVFPHGMIFSNDTKGEGYDAVLLGQADDDTIDIDKMQQKIDSPGYERVKASLMDANFGASTNDAAIDLLATYAGRAPDLELWMKETIDKGNVNTDANLRLQYLAGMWLNAYEETAILQSILHYYHFPTEVFSGSPQQMQLLERALAEQGRARFAPIDLPPAK
jgi:spermidine synthase